MPVVLGLASSHAPSLFAPLEHWDAIHKGLTRQVPQPLELANETPEVITGWIERIGVAFATLRAEIERHELDAMIIVGDDQSEVFSNACNPGIAIYAGEEVSGSTSISWIGQDRKDNHITLKGHPNIATALLDGLLDRDFDPALMERLVPLARPEGGLGHAFTRVAAACKLHETGLPTIPLFVSSYHAPMPSGERCYRLGAAIADIFKDRPERIGIYGSGGLSHDPIGPRAGWVDEPLDRWVLERIEKGEGAKLGNLFTFDSDTVRGGTGEIRSWIVAAGAFDGIKGKVVDYIPARHAVTGLGFATWSRL
jgi:protocatechuate 4,5-dioxygenase beta chain